MVQTRGARTSPPRSALSFVHAAFFQLFDPCHSWSFLSLDLGIASSVLDQQSPVSASLLGLLVAKLRKRIHNLERTPHLVILNWTLLGTKNARYPEPATSRCAATLRVWGISPYTHPASTICQGFFGNESGFRLWVATLLVNRLFRLSVTCCDAPQLGTPFPVRTPHQVHRQS